MMCSSATSSPVSADTFFIRMRLIVRSSSWLNDTPFLLTAWNSLIGMATSPKLIVPLHTGLGMGHIVPHQARQETERAVRRDRQGARRTGRPEADHSKDDGDRIEPEQHPAGILDRRRVHGDV